MKNMQSIVDYIASEPHCVIGVRGDIFHYELMEFTKNSMHFVDDCRSHEGCDNVPESVELDGTSAYLLFEYGEEVDVDTLLEKLNDLIAAAQAWGDIVHIIACECGAYDYGWDEYPAQEIVMRGAWVIGIVETEREF